ncbi:MAG: ABC transporter substrate-binding protein [Acidimicrobiales bacterium]
MGRDEEWINHSSATGNLDATAVDDRTVEVVSSEPDPRLPILDVYIVPKHIYEPIAADDIEAYDGLDGVGSGPYVMESWSPNELDHEGEPQLLRLGGQEAAHRSHRVPCFSNGDAMAAALQQGELDAAHNVPPPASSDSTPTPTSWRSRGRRADSPSSA